MYYFIAIKYLLTLPTPRIRKKNNSNYSNYLLDQSDKSFEIHISNQEFKRMFKTTTCYYFNLITCSLYYLILNYLFELANLKEFYDCKRSTKTNVSFKMERVKGDKAEKEEEEEKE